MLLFVCNGTNQGSIISDTKQMLETAVNDIKENRRLPKEFENKDIPHFMLKLNILHLPAETKPTHNKAYDHYKEQGKKAFHFEVAKADISFFKFLYSHVHRLKLATKYFGKFAKFTATLTNNAPMIDCTHLCQCIQGHLNYHLSTRCITTNVINVLDASELLCNLVNGKSIGQFTLRDFLYQSTWKIRCPFSYN